MEHELSQTQSPFATEPIGRLIVKFAVSSVIALLVNSLYNIVDQIFIGNGVGYLGNGATNIVFPITIIALALAMMIGNGGAAYLSLKLGEGNVNSAKKGIGNAVTMVTAVSIVLAAVFLLFINPILTLFGATDTLRPYALDYLQRKHDMGSGTVVAVLWVKSGGFGQPKKVLDKGRWSLATTSRPQSPAVRGFPGFWYRRRFSRFRSFSAVVGLRGATVSSSSGVFHRRCELRGFFG